MVLVGAGLFLLALATYTPDDPSFNSVGGYADGLSLGREAHNWVGVLGAWIADANLQVLGVAAFLLPLWLIRLGVGWMRSRPAGAPTAKFVGLSLWVIFAPAALALLPGKLLWRGALPVAGLSGRIVADALVRVLNVPGTVIVVAAAVVISLYLATTFTFVSAREWASARFGFVMRLRIWWNGWLTKRRGQAAAEELEVIDENGVVYGAKREKLAAEAEKERLRAEKTAARAHGSNSLLDGLFGWWAKRRGEPVHLVPEVEVGRGTGSVWEAMPRVDVDAPEVTPLSTAAAAAAPYAEALAAAAAPGPHGNGFEPALNHRGPAIEQDEPFAFLSKKDPKKEAAAASVLAPVTEMPKRVAKAKAEELYAAPAMPDPAAFAAEVEAAQAAAEIAAAAGAISFGKRADTDQKAVAITAKSVRGYRLPSSSLLYRNEEQAVVREEALRDEARVLVEKCGEFGVDGQVTQINPGPVVTTFEFRPDAGVKYSRVTGLADDLCLAMAAESILIERMPGKSTVGIQVPNHDRETIWLRDVVECESFAQSKSKLAIALGKDINGRIVTADLASMPHVLIAGSTGSGKSVAINAMIMSVLFKSTPEQVRMIWSIRSAWNWACMRGFRTCLHRSLRKRSWRRTLCAMLCGRWNGD